MVESDHAMPAKPFLPNAFGASNGLKTQLKMDLHIPAYLMLETMFVHRKQIELPSAVLSVVSLKIVRVAMLKLVVRFVEVLKAVSILLPPLVINTVTHVQIALHKQLAPLVTN